MEFLRTLLIAPVALSWFLLMVASGALFISACLIALGVAFVHAHRGESWRELFVTTTRVRISWTWGWSVSCLVLLVYIGVLDYFFDRVASWFAALPYLIVALVALGIAAWLRHSVRTRVVRVQKVLQGGQS
jgi:hypothetical protein